VQHARHVVFTMVGTSCLISELGIVSLQGWNTFLDEPGMLSLQWWTSCLISKLGIVCLYKDGTLS